MMTIAFAALMYVPAILSGIGSIKPQWLILSMLAAWIWSIWMASSKGEIDFRQLSTQEFKRRDSTVLQGTVLRLLSVALVFGIARLFA